MNYITNVAGVATGDWTGLTGVETRDENRDDKLGIGNKKLTYGTVTARQLRMSFYRLAN